MASYTNPSSIFLSIFVLICSISSSEEAIPNNNGITVDLIHRDSPFSPFYNHSETQFDRNMNSFRRSIARSIHLGLSTNTEQVPAAEAPITPDSSGEFLMKILIGTPAVELAAVVDTGSDLTWAQCAPCQNCYDQKPPLYDSTKSKTFQNVSCESDQCKLIGQGVLECDKTKLCRYYVSYGDGSTTLGNIAVETFTIGEASGTFPEVVFGCGNYNYGTFEESMSGIVGLGGGSSSILRQLGTSIGSKFSYCLTSFDSNVSSKISFGSNAVVKGDKVMSTPLKKGASDTFYTVTLMGISVGNTKLEYNSIPESDSGEFGNIIIDSGTPLSIIPKSIYEEVESVLVKAVKGVRVDDPRKADGLCYKSPENGELDSPAMIAHFEGVDLALPQKSNFVEAAKGVVCLTLVPAGLYAPINVLGNIHQRDYLIGFDLENRKMDFLPTDCSKPH